MPVNAREFLDQLRIETNEILNAWDRTLRKGALELSRQVILGTPVDTGRARGAWYASLGSPSLVVGDATDQSGATALGRAIPIAQGFQAGQRFYVTNNVPYGPILEGGRRFDAVANRVVGSLQAPDGWVRQSVQRVDRAFPALAAQEGLTL
ncbi:unnamed protein product [Scytosiphon promiscuus]